MRRAYDAVDGPSEETVAAAREMLLGELGSIESPSPSRPESRRVVVAVAAVILVGGLLVSPAFGIGSRRWATNSSLRLDHTAQHSMLKRHS